MNEGDFVPPRTRCAASLSVSWSVSVRTSASSGPLHVMARHVVARTRLAQLRFLLGTAPRRERATGTEAATRRR